MADDALDPVTQERYAALCRRIREECPAIWLAYPPATGEQFQATEQVLGFPLPPFLRLLYREVGNGGFGPPGIDFLGVLGGRYEEGVFDPLIDQSSLRINKSVADALAHLPGAYILVDELPAQLVPIAYDGCDGSLLLDGKTNFVYRETYGGDLETYLIARDGAAPAHASEHSISMFHHIANSLEEIVDRWLDDINFSLLSILRNAYYELTPEMLDPAFVARPHGLRSHWLDLPQWDDAELHSDIETLVDSEDWRWHRTLQPTDEE